LVYGAAGHTARFVVQALRSQGHTVLLAGRDEAKLKVAYPEISASQLRVVDIEDSASLQRVVAEASAVVNCAGPFADSAGPLLQAAVQARVHYVDIAAEQAVARHVFEQWGQQFEAAGVGAVPAVGFYGALGDLLATAAMGDWPEADAIDLYIALDSWHPTAGSRKTGQRNAGRYLVYRDGQLQAPPATQPSTQWQFAAPFGEQQMVGYTVADAVTVPHHLRVPDVSAWINETPLKELRNADTPPPQAVDASGRSAQQFRVEVVVRRGGAERRAAASGQDIYAVTAPLVAQAVTRLLAAPGQHKGGLSVGQLGDARAFLEALAPQHLVLDF
jgi:hypothetical protein